MHFSYKFLSLLPLFRLVVKTDDAMHTLRVSEKAHYLHDEASWETGHGPQTGAQVA